MYPSEYFTQVLLRVCVCGRRGMMIGGIRGGEGFNHLSGRKRMEGVKGNSEGCNPLDRSFKFLQSAGVGGMVRIKT